MTFSRTLIFGAALVVVFAAVAAQTPRPPAQPGPQLLFPSDYRQWVFLSSGLDMQYKEEKGPQSPGGQPLFENVFVRRTDYDAFLKNRVWPNGTVMVQEKRCSAQKVSIDTNGTTQDKLFLVAASQKAAENGWNYYLFGTNPDPNCSGPDPNFSGQKHAPVSNSDFQAAMCWQCHRKNAKIDNTFIQFYPTLNRPGSQKTYY